MDLSHLRKGQVAQVLGIQSHGPLDSIAQRLLDLGFVVGEQVHCVTVAPFGGDPILVQIGFTRFALRKAEAARVQVEDRLKTLNILP